MPIIESAMTRKRLPKPSSVGSVALDAENIFFSSAGFASAASSLVPLTVIEPSACSSRPMSERWPKVAEAAEAEPASVRSWRCIPVAALSPCRIAPFLATASYLVSVAISLTTAV